MRLLRRAGVTPLSPTDPAAAVVFDGRATAIVDRCLTAGTDYRYAIWSYSGCDAPVYSGGSDSARATPTLPDPPPSPPRFELARAPHELRLYWFPPVPDCATTVVIRRGTSGFPLAPVDGDSAYRGEVTSFIDRNLSPLTTYYYSAFSLDRYGRFSASASQLQGTPEWEYTVVTVPALELYEEFPDINCNPYANCDFERHGPQVDVDAEVRTDGYLTFWVEITRFFAKESQPDFTCATKSSYVTWATNHFRAPTGQGWSFDSYVGNVAGSIGYLDTDYTIDRVQGQGLIDFVDVKGDNVGDDVCGMNEHNTHVHKMVTRPFGLRLRR